MHINVWRNPNGNRNVPYLDNWNDKRKLNLNWFDNRWNANCRFLAVRSSLSFFSPLLGVGLIFCILSEPSAKHSAAFLQDFRNLSVVFGFNYSYFPGELKKKFQKVERDYGIA